MFVPFLLFLSLASSLFDQRRRLRFAPSMRSVEAERVSAAAEWGERARPEGGAAPQAYAEGCAWKRETLSSLSLSLLLSLPSPMAFAPFFCLTAHTKICCVRSLCRTGRGCPPAGGAAAEHQPQLHHRLSRAPHWGTSSCSTTNTNTHTHTHTHTHIGLTVLIYPPSAQARVRHSLPTLQMPSLAAHPEHAAYSVCKRKPTKRPAALAQVATKLSPLALHQSRASRPHIFCSLQPPPMRLLRLTQPNPTR